MSKIFDAGVNLFMFCVDCGLCLRAVLSGIAFLLVFVYTHVMSNRNHKLVAVVCVCVCVCVCGLGMHVQMC